MQHIYNKKSTKKIININNSKKLTNIRINNKNWQNI